MRYEDVACPGVNLSCAGEKPEPTGWVVASQGLLSAYRPVAERETRVMRSVGRRLAVIGVAGVVAASLLSQGTAALGAATSAGVPARAAGRGAPAGAPCAASPEAPARVSSSALVLMNGDVVRGISGNIEQLA